MVELEAITGAAIQPYLGALAALRIAVFREYPYLYVGSLEYEREYLATYASSPHHLVVIARDGDRVVGAATAMPIAAHLDDLAPSLAAAGYPVDTVCYFGESVLERAYRGRGIGHAFFDAREAHAKASGFRTAAFCAVERPAHHTLRPANYVPHDAFWTKRGYTRHPQIRAELSWLDIDETTESAKPMVFWTKAL